MDLEWPSSSHNFLISPFFSPSLQNTNDLSLSLTLFDIFIVRYFEDNTGEWSDLDHFNYFLPFQKQIYKIIRNIYERFPSFLRRSLKPFPF